MKINKQDEKKIRDVFGLEEIMKDSTSLWGKSLRLAKEYKLSYKETKNENRIFDRKVDWKGKGVAIRAIHRLKVELELKHNMPFERILIDRLLQIRKKRLAIKVS